MATGNVESAQEIKTFAISINQLKDSSRSGGPSYDNAVETVLPSAALCNNV